MTQDASENSTKAAAITRGVIAYVLGSRDIFEPLGDMSPLASASGVKICFIGAPDGEPGSFNGLGFVLLKFSIPSMLTDEPFEFMHNFIFQFEGRASGTVVELTKAVIRDSRFFERGAPPDGGSTREFGGRSTIRSDDPDVTAALLRLVESQGPSYRRHGEL